MAKGAYTVICYQEDLEKSQRCIDDVISSAHLFGAETAYILHDKDQNEDGTLKKAHYHIVLGWETGFPTWSKFVEWQKQNYCSSPGGKPPRKYFEPTARVKSIYGIMHYLTHEEWKQPEEL